MKAWDEMTAHEMVEAVRADLLAEQEANDSVDFDTRWDAGLTAVERAAAIKADIEKAERERGNAPLPHPWLDPRSANLLGNYVTR